MRKQKLSIPKQRDKGRWYCGPFAIAAITGESFTEVRAVANRVVKRPDNKGITGMSEWRLCKTLQELGFWTKLNFKWLDNPGAKKIVFKEWLKKERDNSFYLVVLTGHFVVVKGDQFIDNHSKHPVHVNFAPWQRKQVYEVYRVGN